MIVKSTGTYRLTKPLRVRNLTTITELPAGTEVSILAIDPTHHKVYSPALLDWSYWDLPVEPIPKGSSKRAILPSGWIEKRVKELATRLSSGNKVYVQHFKGNTYEVVGYATNCTDGRLNVAYKDLSGSLFVRDYGDFFSEVEVNGNWVPRFL